MCIVQARPSRDRNRKVSKKMINHLLCNNTSKIYERFSVLKAIVKKQTCWDTFQVKLKKVLFFSIPFCEYSFVSCFNKDKKKESGMFLPFMLNAFTTFTQKKHMNIYICQTLNYVIEKDNLNVCVSSQITPGINRKSSL